MNIPNKSPGRGSQSRLMACAQSGRRERGRQPAGIPRPPGAYQGSGAFRSCPGLGGMRVTG